MLVNEMFNKHDKEIAFRIGNPVPWESIEKLDLTKKSIAKKMRKQVYLLGKKKKRELFASVENVVHPAKSRLIRKELMASELIGETNDCKQIYLFDYQPNSSVMREVGRLREISFRMVREGTGTSIDLDEYDRYYRHLILWDDKELEIVGSYRIGAYLLKHPDIRYMFGPVSLSASYPDKAKQLISSFYGQLFGNEYKLARARNPYKVKRNTNLDQYAPMNNEDDYKPAFSELKRNLDKLGVRVPTLYKQYVELCHPGGCKFLDFNKDENFSDCIDALILVDLEKVKVKKRDRYINSHHNNKEKSAA